jgi:hypothetical protein
MVRALHGRVPCARDGAGELPVQDIPPSSSSGLSRAFWPRLTRALGLLLVASAAHVWVDGVLRIPSSADRPSVQSDAPSTLVPPSRLRASAHRPAESRVSVITERILVASPGAAVEVLQHRARLETGAVATTGFVAEVIAADPPAPHSGEATQQLGDRVAEATPAEDAADAAGDPGGMPLVQVSRLTALPAERARITAPVEADQQQLVRNLLQQYVTAFELLDVDAAQAVWPTVDEKALRRAFNQLQSQRVTFESCGITIAGSDANARCRGQATYHPRVGSRALHVPAREWTFQLARAKGGWQIVDAKVR